MNSRSPQNIRPGLVGASTAPHLRTPPLRLPDHILPLDSPGAAGLMGCRALESKCQGRESSLPRDTVPWQGAPGVASPVREMV